MKTACLFAALSLALSVSAAATVPCNDNNNNGKIREGQRNSGSHNGASSSTVARGASSAVSPSTGIPSASPAPIATKGSSSATSAAAGSAGEQSLLTLDSKVIATGFKDNGQDVPTAGQVPSLTSSNNFINFCLTVPNLPITNGKQITTGSCNPAPMGVIPSKDNMPSAKFVFPTNGATISAGTPFTIKMAVQNFESGNFVNPDENYFAAPQQVNAQGQIIGHSHVVVEALSALDQTAPLDPKKFTFFQGLNSAAVNGVLSANVAAGLPAGFYKLSSINTAANHQPVLAPVAQHGSLDDAVYFTVKSNGAAGAGAAASVSSSASHAASATANPSKSTKGKQGNGFRKSLLGRTV
jgi:hypothetical protein